ncbi:peptide chain release factor-like protein [Myroides odoratus]|uniref:peptide chain release factor-like protein n=1 Tax=Myroides odoratus TaxID=256 RepID=UPI0039AFD150
MEEKDLVYQPIRISGVGGQHVNKVSSAIRIIHIPSGLQLVAMDSRSQHQNKKLAKKRLLEKLKQRNENTLELKEKQNWLNQLQINRGNSIRTFIGSHFKSKGSN